MKLQHSHDSSNRDNPHARTKGRSLYDVTFRAIIMDVAAAEGPKFICFCYFSRNIFLQQYKLHVTYHDEGQFTKDFRTVSFTTSCVCCWSRT